jgi:hypothetical protein
VRAGSFWLAVTVPCLAAEVMARRGAEKCTRYRQCRPKKAEEERDEEQQTIMARDVLPSGVCRRLGGGCRRMGRPWSVRDTVRSPAARSVYEP